MKRTSLYPIFALASLLALAGAAVAEPGGEPGSFFQLEARRLGGETESLERYRGQVLLVVNTASRCGYTPQFEGLQALYDRYRGQGFSVLGFPSNDFGGQEPGTEPEIGAFCRSNYGVEFPMFSKVRVKGPEPHPVYRYLRSLPEPIGGDVRWNFQKYLVARNGDVVGRFESRVTPQDPKIVGEVERLLAEPRPASTDAALER